MVESYKIVEARYLPVYHVGIPHGEYPGLFCFVISVISAFLSVFLAAEAASTPAA